MSKLDKYIDEVSTAKLSQQAARINDGIYELILKRFTFIEEGFKGDSIVVEFYVLAARPQTVPADLLRPGEQPGSAMPNAVGTICGTAQNMSDRAKREISTSVLMGLFAAMFGWTRDYAESENPAIVAERKTKLVEALRGDGTAFAGYPIACETYRARTKKGEIHVRTRFTNMPTTPEEIAECRKLVVKSAS